MVPDSAVWFQLLAWNKITLLPVFLVGGVVSFCWCWSMGLSPSSIIHNQFLYIKFTWFKYSEVHIIMVGSSQDAYSWWWWWWWWRRGIMRKERGEERRGKPIVVVLVLGDWIDMFPWIIFCNLLVKGRGLANFCQGPHSEYFRLCGPYNLCWMCSAASVVPDSLKSVSDCLLLTKIKDAQGILTNKQTFYFSSVLIQWNLSSLKYFSIHC